MSYLSYKLSRLAARDDISDDDRIVLRDASHMLEESNWAAVAAMVLHSQKDVKLGCEPMNSAEVLRCALWLLRELTERGVDVASILGVLADNLRDGPGGLDPMELAAFLHEKMGGNMTDTRFAVYYEGGTVDRFWVAPAGLDLGEAKKQKKSRLYATNRGAVMKMLDLERKQESKA